MSPVFDKSALYRRWLHLPSLAVIALAGASVAIAYKGIDAWRDRWMPHHEQERLTTQLVGRAEIPHVRPDHIDWSVSVSASAFKDDEAERVLAAQTQKTIDKLLAAGVTRDEIVVGEPTIVAPDTQFDDMYGGLTGQRQAPRTVEPYEGSQEISIHSLRVVASLGAYQAVALQPTESLVVTAPTCWTEETGALRVRAQDLAWDDLGRQMSQLRHAHVALGRSVAVDVSDVEVSAGGESSTCELDQTATATVSVSYELR